MKAIHPALLALAVAACASTADDDVAPGRVGTTSNAPAGAAAASNAGTRAVGAYGAIGTSDDVRGRTSSSSASQLNGRATMAGSDSGTDDDAADDDDDPPRR
jgi:hypothetical protein